MSLIGAELAAAMTPQEERHNEPFLHLPTWTRKGVVSGSGVVCGPWYCLTCNVPKEVAMPWTHRWVWARPTSCKGLRCVVLVRGKLNSALVRWENGREEIVSRNGMRKLEVRHDQS